MKQKITFSEEIVKFFFIQIAYTLEFIHENKIAHLDLKLENILLDEYFNIRIGDFGSSLFCDETRTNLKRGSPKYIAPEISNIQAGETYNPMKSDIYSLGVILYVMLFNKFP